MNRDAYIQEEETLKLFSRIQRGRDYEWVNEEGERHVLRVESKRLTLGKETKVEVSGVFFYLDASGEPRGEGWPAYSSVWNRVFPNMKRWEGTKPRRNPLHAEYFCADCRKVLSDEVALSPCCEEAVHSMRIFKGEHDETCLCEDCKPCP